MEASFWATTTSETNTTSITKAATNAQTIAVALNILHPPIDHSVLLNLSVNFPLLKTTTTTTRTAKIAS